MSSTQEVVILARLAGTRQFLVDNQKLIVSQQELAASTAEVGMAMEHTARRSWLMNQALFTLRRLTYMTTLAFLAFGAAAVKMGFDFNNAMQTATVALRPFFDNTQQLNGALNRLWLIAKYTPFQIKDMTLAFRALYPSLHSIGITSGETIDTIQALIDALSVAGKVTGPALQRATIALQHMAFQGRLTGITVNQLARDGIPMFAILHKELGLNADQMKRIGDLGIPASVAMRAIIQYMRTTPGYANAAMRQSRLTLTGLWSTFKDNVSRMMGMLEKDAFGGIQNRIAQLDNWFNGFFQRFNGQAVSARQVLVYAFGSGAGKIYDQLSADLRLLWSSFENVVKAVVSSKALWASLFAALVILHGILVPIAYVTQHFGWVIWILIPALITWKVTTELLIARLKMQAFWTAVNTGATKDLTFAQFVMRGALWAYYGVLGRVILSQQVLARWLQVLRYGYIRTAAGQFAVMTTTEKMILRYRALAITLYERVIPAFVRLAIAETVAWLAALGPIALVIAALVALWVAVIYLYFKWKAFHDIVNATVMFMWHHPILLWFIPIIGPLIFAIRMLAYFNDLWHKLGVVVHTVVDFIVWAFKGLAEIIISPFRRVFGFIRWEFNLLKMLLGGVFQWIADKISWLGRKLKSLWEKVPGHQILEAAPGFIGKYVLGLAEGGMLRQPSWTLVGERGPELLLLPGGAAVLPLSTNLINPDLRSQRGMSQPAAESFAPKPRFMAGSQFGQDFGSDRPLVIQLTLGRKVLEEVMVDRQGARMARR